MKNVLLILLSFGQIVGLKISNLSGIYNVVENSNRVHTSTKLALTADRIFKNRLWVTFSLVFYTADQFS